MDFIKVLAVMAAGLGSTGIARLAADAPPGVGKAEPTAVETPAPDTAQAEAATTAAGAEPAGAARAPPPRVDDMTREEMEAELRKAEEELGGKPAEPGEKEFRASRPLPADLPIDLPSDI